MFCRQCVSVSEAVPGYCQGCLDLMARDLDQRRASESYVTRRRRSSSADLNSTAPGMAVPYRPLAGAPSEWRSYLEQEQASSLDLASYPKVFLQVVNECKDCEVMDESLDCDLLRIRKTDPEARYHLQQVLAQGDSGGIVYKALDIHTGKLVAVKVIKLASRRDRAPVMREVAMLGIAQREWVVRYVETFDYHK